MSRSKQLWVNEVEAILDDYLNRKTTREYALAQLMSKGFDLIDAEAELDAIDEGEQDLSSVVAE